MNNKKRVAIIIINYNGNKDTLECLTSIDKHCIRHDYSVFLLDNCSTHPLQETELSSCSVPITYIKSEDNSGFAGGNNMALNHINLAVFNYVFLLNNDTLLTDDSVDRLVDILDVQRGVIGGLVNYYYDNPNEMWQAGCFFRTSRLKSKELRTINDESQDLVYVDSIPGSSMMIPSEIIQQVGLFDERFFAYYEEFDLCARAKEKGFRVAFLPSSRILHKVGRSSSSRLKHYLRSRNTLLFYSIHDKKHIWMAYCRVLLRTVKEWVKSSFMRDYFTPAFYGIHDFHKKCYYKGRMSRFV